jgi:hypothetical protein
MRRKAKHLIRYLKVLKDMKGDESKRNAKRLFFDEEGIC